MKHILIILGIIALISCQSSQIKEEEASNSIETHETQPEALKEAKEVVKFPESPKFDEIGFATWYGVQFQGKPTASGEIFDRFKFLAKLF